MGSSGLWSLAQEGKSSPAFQTQFSTVWGIRALIYEKYKNGGCLLNRILLSFRCLWERFDNRFKKAPACSLAVPRPGRGSAAIPLRDFTVWHQNCGWSCQAGWFFRLICATKTTLMMPRLKEPEEIFPPFYFLVAHGESMQRDTANFRRLQTTSNSSSPQQCKNLWFFSSSNHSETVSRALLMGSVWFSVLFSHGMASSGPLCGFS